MVGYAVLYPTILRVSGAQVLGLWAVLAAVLAYLNLADLGFSQVIVRTITSRPSDYSDVRSELLAIRRFYSLVIASLVIVTPFLRNQIAAVLGGTLYAADRVTASLAIVAVAGGIMQWNKAQEAVLGAFQDNTFASAIYGTTPVLLFSVAIVGASAGAPLEGLALGNLCCVASRTILLGERLRRRHGVRLPARTERWVDSVSTIRSIAERGRGLYGASIGLFLREPTLRLCIASVAGLTAVAAYDIAQRVTNVVRTAVSGGVAALFPAMSLLYAKRQWAAVRAALETATVALFGFGVVALGALLTIATPLFDTWLGSVPDGLVEATVLLALWHAVTLGASAFWYLLLATGRERFAAQAVWFQMVAVICMWVIGLQATMTLDAVLYVWLASSIVVQGLILFAAERELGMVGPVLRSSYLGILVAVGWVILLSSAGRAVLGRSLPAWTVALLCMLLCTYATAVFVFLWSRRNSIRRRLQGGLSQSTGTSA